MTAYCGLNCSKCEAFIATRKDDATMRAATAKKWSALYKADIKADQINCKGCKSDGIRFSHCDVCDIRQCCQSNGVENCAVCKLAAFISIAPEAGKALDKIRHAAAS